MSEPPRRSGAGLWVLLSLLVHGLLLFTFARRAEVRKVPEQKEMLRYVELMRQTPQFTEAPGPAVEKAPLNAPYSDANRKASTPEPTGDRPTTRPGRGDLPFVPGSGPRGEQTPPQPRPQAPQQARQGAQQQPGPPSDAPTAAPVESTARIQPLETRPRGGAGGAVDWKAAISDVGRIAAMSGNGMATSGGEEGYAESGPLSFETQWYDWGPYAASMVAKIRTHWYENMPSIVRMGMKGVVVIRFTIQRDGRITDITTVESSTIPPFDFAARKAIELSSPLNPLPRDFPNASERVTCAFYYNVRPEQR